MRILLDENMPEAVRTALGRLGHNVDSVDTLRLKGIDNGRLLGAIATGYDLCFTKDRGFARAAKAAGASGGAKVLRVGIPQAPGDEFARAFVEAFQRSDWSAFATGDDWPAS